MGSCVSVPKEIADASTRRRHEIVHQAIQKALSCKLSRPRYSREAVLQNACFALSYLHDDFLHVDVSLIAEWEAARVAIARHHALDVRCDLSTDANLNLNLRYTLVGTTDIHLYAFKRDSNALRTTARGLLEVDCD